MKRIVLALAGIADEPLEVLDGKTPLEVAKAPNLRLMAQRGSIGRLRLPGDDGTASEAAACLGLLGYGANGASARGPLQASAINLTATPHQTLLACRLITVENEKLVDPHAGRIGERESAVLLESLNRAFREQSIRFYSGENRTHVMALQDTDKFKNSEALMDLNLQDPESMVGREVWAGWGRSAAAANLKDVLLQAAEILEAHEINKVRVDLNENPANHLWVWGPGTPIALDPFRLPPGGAAILSSSDVWKGVGRAARLTVASSMSHFQIEPSDLSGLTEQLKGWVRQQELLFVHLDGADRASRAGDYKKKIRWIEAFDQHVIGPLLASVGTDARIVIASGYVASTARRERISPEAPMLSWDAGVAASGGTEFSEEAANKGSEVLVGGAAFFKKLMGTA
jgi:2,3-bisphosphoglycerate-independent phosphoglycerate mutase